MTRTGILGTIAAALLLASMFAPLFGAALTLTGKWGPRLSCSECGYEGEWPGSRCPRCGK